uniref:Uncharacterized protein n=1 Tax=Rhizophora mucronata TaxID=61149 RepID=A0A2P2NZI7_RHIMU
MVILLFMYIMCSLKLILYVEVAFFPLVTMSINSSSCIPSSIFYIQH